MFSLINPGNTKTPGRASRGRRAAVVLLTGLGLPGGCSTTQPQTFDTPEAADYHIFNHLLDAAGARVTQADGAAFAARQWRAGDGVVSRFVLPVPADVAPPLTMRVGMYRFPSLESVPVLDEAANPAGDFVEIPLE